MQRAAALMVPILLVVSPTASAETDPREALTPEEWRQDVRDLSDGLKRIHPGVFDGGSEAAFDAKVNELLAAIPSMNYSQVVVGILQVVAQIKDAHTVMSTMSATERERGTRSFFPIRLVRFDESMYISAVRRGYADLLGARVVRYGNVTMEEALSRARTVVAHENEGSLRRRLPLVLMVPVVLSGLGIVDGSGPLEVELIDRADRRRVVELSSIEGTSKSTSWYSQGEGLSGDDWVSLLQVASGAPPLSLQHPTSLAANRDRYWYALDESSATFYFQFNRVRDKREEPLELFWPRFWQAFDESGARRLVIDLRNNSGGNNQLVKPLIHGIIKRDALNRTGNLFVLISHKTYSAAVSLTAWLENETAAVFAGEPTGQRPNFYSDPERLLLPHSQMKAEVSRYCWQNTYPWDDRPAVFPDIVADITLDDVLANRDPLLEKVLAIQDYRGLTGAISAVLEAGSEEEVRRVYKEFKRHYPDAWKTTEGELNDLGYSLLERGLTEQAQTVFRLNAESYPDSANTWDSLAESYLIAGDRREALALYRRALALDPKNDRLKQRVARLEAGD